MRATAENCRTCEVSSKALAQRLILTIMRTVPCSSKKMIGKIRQKAVLKTTVTKSLVLVVIISLLCPPGRSGTGESACCHETVASAGLPHFIGRRKRKGRKILTAGLISSAVLKSYLCC